MTYIYVLVAIIKKTPQNLMASTKDKILLPEFESVKTKIPSIKYSRFRLMPMNGNQAYEVITKTWKNKIIKVILAKWVK